MTRTCQYDREPGTRKFIKFLCVGVISGLLGLVIWVLPGPASAQAVDPARQHAAELLDQLESGLETLRSGDIATYQTLTRLLGTSRDAIRELVGESDPEVRHFSDRWDQARERLVSAAEHWSDTSQDDAPTFNHPAVALRRNAGLLLRDMENVPADALSHPDIHSHFTNRVYLLSERLVELKAGPHVAPARAAIAQLTTFLAENGPGRAYDDLFRKYMPGNRQVLRVGAGPAETAAWFAAMKTLTSTALAEDSRALAQDIAAGRRARSDAGVFKRSVVDRWVPDIMSDLSAALAAIDARVADAVAFADQVLAVETTTRADVWRLVGPAHYEQHMNLLQEGVAALAVAQAADEAIGREQGPDREKQQKSLKDAKKAFALLRHAVDSKRR